KFVVLGGPTDTFCEKLASSHSPEQVKNLAGKLTLLESCAVVEMAKAVVSNDTGILHIADQMKIPTLAIIGPTAFGYPSAPTSITIETPMWCKPCTKDGRGLCIRLTYQKCLRDITPIQVANKLRTIL